MAKHRREYRWRSRLGLAAVAFGISLMLIEGLLRAVWHNSYGLESTEHYLRLRVQPSNRNYEVDRRLIDRRNPVVRLRTDRRSYILPSVVHDAADATIVFLGGSTTECIAVAERLRFPALVSALLGEHGLKVNTLNAARSGNTVQDSINVLLNHVIYDRPDIVVLQNTANDIGVLSRPPGYGARVAYPLSAREIGRWIKQTLCHYCYTIAFVRKALADTNVRQRPLECAERRDDPSVARRVPIEEYMKRLRAFVHLCRDFDMEPVLMTQPLSGVRNALTPEWADLGTQDRFNHAVRQIGEEEGVLVIDLVRYVQEEVIGWEEPMRVFYDGMHVTDEGSKLYAQHIAAQLLPLLEAH